MKKAVISIIKAFVSVLLAIVLVIVIYNAYQIANCGIDFRDFAFDYDSFGLCNTYTIDDENYALYSHHGGVPILYYVYSYSVSGNYVYLYGEDEVFGPYKRPLIYMVADYKNNLIYKYKNIDDSPVESIGSIWLNCPRTQRYLNQSLLDVRNEY